jgi:DNA-binding NarL/FixJ family response regulator
MSVRVAVLDPLPAYRRGILAILKDNGANPETIDELPAWIEEGVRHVVFLTLESDHDWEALTRLRQTRVELLVVAVLTDSSLPVYVRAISAGAVAAMPRDASPERVQRVFDALLHGSATLPIKVVHALASRASTDQTGEVTSIELPANEISWLRELASGATVARLADQSGYSERAMFRLLRDLYRRMGVGTRTEALMYAQQRGWLSRP